MKSTIAAYLNEKKAPPAPVPDEKPGFGPTLDGVAFELWTPEKVKGPAPADPEMDQKVVPPAATDGPALTGTPTGGWMPWIIAGFAGAVLIGILAVVFRKKPA
jgi:hypothetical protein